MTRAHLLAVFAVAAVVRAPTASAQTTAGLPVWRVDPEPEVVIGQVDGPDEYLLTNPLEGMVFSDGTIVIRDSVRGLFELRYYDGDGRYITTASRWGQGPFEFHVPNGVMPLPGDSVLVVGRDGRFAVFGARGEREREGRMRTPISSPLGHEYIGSGRFTTITAGPGDVPLGTARFPMAFLSQGLEGAIDTVAVLPSENTYRGRDGNMLRQPFSPFVGWGAGAGTFWVGQTDVPELYGYDVDGRLMTTIRLDRAPVEVTRADRTRWTDAYVERRSRVPTFDRRAFESALDEVGFPDVLPLWHSLRVDRLGNVWVSRYDLPWTEGPQHWDVFDRSGEPIATVAVPEEIVPSCFRSVTQLTCRRIFQIGADYMLMMDLDDLRVPRVKKYRLVKP